MILLKYLNLRENNYSTWLHIEIDRDYESNDDLGLFNNFSFGRGKRNIRRENK